MAKGKLTYETEQKICHIYGSIGYMMEQILADKEEEIQKLKMELAECKDQFKDCKEECDEMREIIEAQNKEVKEKFPKGYPQLHVVALVDFSNYMEPLDRNEKYRLKREKFPRAVQIVRRTPETYNMHMKYTIIPYKWKILYEKRCFIETQSFQTVGREICNKNFNQNDFFCFANRIYLTEENYDEFVKLMITKIDSFMSEKDKEISNKDKEEETEEESE